MIEFIPTLLPIVLFFIVSIVNGKRFLFIKNTVIISTFFVIVFCLFKLFNIQDNFFVLKIIENENLKINLNLFFEESNFYYASSIFLYLVTLVLCNDQSKFKKSFLLLVLMQVFFLEILISSNNNFQTLLSLYGFIISLFLFANKNAVWNSNNNEKTYKIMFFSFFIGIFVFIFLYNSFLYSSEDIITRNYKLFEDIILALIVIFPFIIFPFNNWIMHSLGFLKSGSIVIYSFSLFYLFLIIEKLRLLKFREEFFKYILILIILLLVFSTLKNRPLKNISGLVGLIFSYLVFLLLLIFITFDYKYLYYIINSFIFLFSLFVVSNVYVKKLMSDIENIINIGGLAYISKKLMFLYGCFLLSISGVFPLVFLLQEVYALNFLINKYSFENVIFFVAIFFVIKYLIFSQSWFIFFKIFFGKRNVDDLTEAHIKEKSSNYLMTNIFYIWIVLFGLTVFNVYYYFNYEFETIGYIVFLILILISILSFYRGYKMYCNFDSINLENKIKKTYLNSLLVSKNFILNETEFKLKKSASFLNKYFLFFNFDYAKTKTEFFLKLITEKVEYIFNRNILFSISMAFLFFWIIIIAFIFRSIN